MDKNGAKSTSESRSGFFYRAGCSSVSRSRRGFTLVEILVAIAIIGMLTTIAIIATGRAKDLAKETKAKADLREIRNAINMMLSDTAKWPNGCRPDRVSNPEVSIDSAQAGLKQVPTVGDQGDGCYWTASDVNNWKGPYVLSAVDPWGRAYWFDPDFVPYQNCDSKEEGAQLPAIVTFGPNGVGLNVYDCDDLYLTLR